MTDRLDLRAVKTFPSLVKYLRDELDWPIESDDVEDLTFDYEPEELGLDAKTAVKIKEIKQLRPLASNQPWGIFFINFEPKQLPIVALRRILRALVFKKRLSGSRAQQKTWQLNDLLFISSYGDSSERAITLAHFSEDSRFGDLPTLRVLGWDAQDTVLHLEDAEQTLKTKLHWPDNAADVESWRSTWASAFTLRPHEVVRTSRELAVKLADLATVIRERANKVLAIESASGPFRKLHQAFQEALIHDLSQDDFADMYAQTIAYGLLTAHVSRPAGLVAENIVDIVPNTNPFLKELLGTFLRVGGRKGKIDFDELGINEVVELLRNADMDAVLRDFGDRNPNEDPVIHFYELFLKEYDPQKRMKRGVFYTPRPVVSFIVRSVDEILRTEFGLEDGLADVTTWGEMAERHAGLELPEGASPEAPFVQILDPATGTGTFLVEVIEVIHKTMVEKWRKQGTAVYEIQQRWDDYVQRDLLPRLHGFELMMAPYAIAHMKIGLKLRETGYSFFSSERARVYLTNTLEEPKDFSDYFEQMAPALAHEAQAANKIKRATPITVVIGNPPYSVSSQNDGAWINELNRDFKRGLEGERNIQPLSDDYVKFLRYAAFRIQSTSAGTIGLITNREYIQGVILRGVRRSLLEWFPRVSIVDLHGQVGEQVSGAEADKNVFDIEKGVTISLFRCLRGFEEQVRYSELVGSAERKYSLLLTSELNDLPSTKLLSPEGPDYFLKPWDREGIEEYKRFPNIKSLFNGRPVTGFASHRDAFAIAFAAVELKARVKDFVDPSLRDDEIKTAYNLTDTRDWSLSHARTIARRDPKLYGRIVPCSYRPFDTRYVIYSDDILEFSRRDTMRHVSPQTPALICARIVKDEDFAHVSVVAHPVEKIYLSPKSSNNAQVVLTRSLDLGTLNGRQSPVHWRLSTQALHHFSQLLKPRDQGSLEEEVFHYIYAILHSLSYRRRYAEFLRIDFPRIPLTSDANLVGTLAGLGADLVALHLLEDDYRAASWRTSNLKPRGPLQTPITQFDGSGAAEIAKGYPKYLDGSVFINTSRSFSGVPEEVWNFHVGGYQVCEKWLKDRRGRMLSDEDITHYQCILIALNETIRLMGEIDAVIEEHGGWPLVGSQDAPKPSEPDQLPFA